MTEWIGCPPCPEGEECRFFDVTITSKSEEFGMKYTTYIIGHCGYWLINFINVVALLVIEGWVFGRLSKNFLSKLSLAACCLQILSCTCSITRFNVGQELHPLAYLGSFLSLAASLLLNISYLYVLSTSRRFVQIGTVFWILVTLGVSYTMFAINPFLWVRRIAALFYVYQIVCIFFAIRKVKAGTIIIDAVNKDSVHKLFIFCLVLNVLSFGLAGTLMPIFYPTLGFTFICNVIFMALLGRSSGYMSKIEAGEDGTIGEREPLNDSA